MAAERKCGLTSLVPRDSKLVRTLSCPQANIASKWSSAVGHLNGCVTRQKPNCTHGYLIIIMQELFFHLCQIYQLIGNSEWMIIWLFLLFFILRRHNNTLILLMLWTDTVPLHSWGKQCPRSNSSEQDVDNQGSCRGTRAQLCPELQC